MFGIRRFGALSKPRFRYTHLATSYKAPVSTRDSISQSRISFSQPQGSQTRRIAFEKIDSKEADQNSKNAKFVSKWRRKGQLDYFYAIASFESSMLQNGYGKMVKHENGGSIVDKVIGHLIDQNDAGLINELASLRRYVSGESKEEWIRVLSMLDGLPNRWNVDRMEFNISKRGLDQISHFISSFIVDYLSNYQLIDFTNDQLSIILNLFCQFYSSSSDHRLIFQLIQRLSENCSKLSKDEFLRLLFSIGLYRFMPKSNTVRFGLENELIRRFPDWTIQQLWLGAFAFYQTDTPFIGTRLLDLIIRKDVNHFGEKENLNFRKDGDSASDKGVESRKSEPTTNKSVNSIIRQYDDSIIKSGNSIADIVDQRTDESIVDTKNTSDYGPLLTVKLLKLNGRHDHVDILSFMARSLITKPSSTYSFVYWSHFASACRQIRYYNAELAEKILDKMMSELDYARLKDVVLVLSYLTTMNHPIRREMVDILMGFIRRSCDDKWPNQSVRALYALSLMDVYPIDLISRVLRADYLRHFRAQRNNLERLPARALYWLDCSVAIERPEYDGHRLDLSLFGRPDILDLLEDTATIQCKEPVNSPLIVVAQMIPMAIACAGELVFQGLVLPHSPSPGLLVKFRGGHPVNPNVDISLRNLRFEELKVAEDEKRVAIFLLTEGNCRRQSSQFLGQHVAHQRQLQKLGYKILIIDPKALPKMPAERGVKRLQRFFKQLELSPEQSIFHY